MRTVAIIQARATGDRLPGKVLLPLAGKSMLQNVVERVKRAKKLDDVVVAVPEGDIAALSGCGATIMSFAVHEDDLIERYYAAAKATRADLIVRICADNPFVEPENIDYLVPWGQKVNYPLRHLITNAENYLKNHDGFGGELYAREMLEWMDATIRSDDYAEHPHKFWEYLRLSQYVGRPYWFGLRLDVNTQSDYERAKRIYDHFGSNDFHISDVLAYLDAEKMMGA